MELGLTGKVALVLGASGGLGSGIARSLASEGVRVALAGRRVDVLDQVASSLSSEALVLKWDLADLGMIDPSVAMIERVLGDVDILVNITGGPPPTPVAGQSASAWNENFGSMVLPVFAITDRVLPEMKARGWGRILTSTSSGIVAPIPNLGMSNALRSALVGWNKTLSNEVGRFGITCNVVVPGRIATDRVAYLDESRAQRQARTVAEVKQASCTEIPLGRYGGAEEYADVITFLASAKASYVTGSTIRVDGGLITSV